MMFPSKIVLIPSDLFMFGFAIYSRITWSPATDHSTNFLLGFGGFGQSDGHAQGVVLVVNAERHLRVWPTNSSHGWKIQVHANSRVTPGWCLNPK